jgi:hypothetical protein
MTTRGLGLLVGSSALELWVLYLLARKIVVLSPRAGAWWRKEWWRGVGRLSKLLIRWGAALWDWQGRNSRR